MLKTILKRLRTLTRFSIRTALLVTAIVALWLGWYCEGARRQKEAADRVRHLGGRVFYRSEVSYTNLWWFELGTFPSCPLELWRSPNVRTWLADRLGRDFTDVITGVELTERHVDSAILSRVACLPDLEWLDLDRARMERSALSSLKRMRKVRYLSLARTCVEDLDMAFLTTMPCLEELDLTDTKVGNAGLAYAGALPELRRAFVAGTRVDDVGVTRLARLPKLELLDLSQTAVTDKGMRAIAESTTLREVQLSGTHVTDEGLRQLAALPRLEVIK